MKFLKRVNYLGSFTTLFILTGISFAFIIFFMLYIEALDFQHRVDMDKAKHEIQLKKEKTYDFYSHFEKFLLTIEHNRFLTSYLKTPNAQTKKDFITLFTTLSEHERSITQLRYLDEKGNEIIRVERAQPDVNIFLVPEKKLQNKKHRDYFEETMVKKKGKIFVSKLDLNIEHKKIEIPYKPVWRFAMPVFNGKQKKGIIIVNVFGKYLLDDISHSDSFYIDIFDEDSQVLVSSDKTKPQWTRYLKTTSQLQKEKFILSDVLIDGLNDEVLYIGLTPKEWLNSFFRILNLNIALLLLFIILIAFVLAYFLSKIPKKLFDELEVKQKMLVQQSKVAAMGEMTSMLAHQWRQPLNTISVLIQEIEIKRSMEILNDEEFKKLSDKIKSTLFYMSETIDNFRDFFKPKKEKEQFCVLDVIKDAYNILDMKLKSKNISYEIHLQKSCDASQLVIYSYEGEFKQVLVSVLNNAIEAIELQNDLEKSYYVDTFVGTQNNMIIVRINDNAGGIQPEILESLFEPYSSTKLEKNGTGLGLYMSQMIIENSMKGSIQASNTKEGASFIITISQNK